MSKFLICRIFIIIYIIFIILAGTYEYFIPPTLCSATQLTNGPELAQRRKATTRKPRAVLTLIYLNYGIEIASYEYEYTVPEIVSKTLIIKNF